MSDDTERRFRRAVDSILEGDDGPQFGTSAGVYTPANGRPTGDNLFRTAYLDANVPCNGCIECCKGPNTVFLREDDDESQYETRAVRTEMGFLTALAIKDNGDCIYLGDEGCTIHDRRPGFCRSFDCRVGVECDFVPMRIREAAARLIERTTGEVVDLGAPLEVPVRPQRVYVLEPTVDCPNCRGYGTRPLQWNDPHATEAEAADWKRAHRNHCTWRGRVWTACALFVYGVSKMGAIRAFAAALSEATEECSGTHPVKCARCSGTGTIDSTTGAAPRNG